MQIATQAGGTFLPTVGYLSFILWPLLRNAICWSSFQWKKKTFYACCFARVFGIPAGSVAQ